MNKKKLIALISAGAALIIIIVAVVCIMMKGDSDNPVDNPNNNGDNVTENTDGTESLYPVVEDIKDKMTVEALAQALEGCEKLSEKYNLVHGESNSMYRLGTSSFRIKTIETYEGIGKDDSGEEFVAEITGGYDGNPEVMIAFTTTTLTPEDAEELAYEILSKVTSEELINLLHNLDYNNSFWYDTESTSETGQKLKIVKRHDKYPAFNSYIYSMVYENKKEETVASEYKFADYDKQLFKHLPIFSKSSVIDVAQSLSAVDLGLLHGGNKAVITTYTSSYTGNVYNNSLGVEITSKTGEKLSTSFTFNWVEGNDTFDYTFDTMTPYMSSMDAALDKAIEIYNGITGKNMIKEDLSDFGGSEIEKNYGWFDHEALEKDGKLSMVNITIKEEPTLGYYAIIQCK